MQTVIIGRFGKVFGLKGWINVRSYTDPQLNILNYAPWLIKHPNQDELETLLIEKSKPHGKSIIVKLPNCDTPEEARLYTNLEIAVDRNLLPETDEDEFYWSDLEGMAVINEQNINFGEVDYITNTGANDIIVVKDEKTHRERWVPYIENVIKNIDSKKRIIRVDWDADF